MQLDFTNITDTGGGMNLPPGRYEVLTDSHWTASESTGGHMKVFVPLIVVEKGEFEGETAAYYHTIMLHGDPKAIRTNKVFTLRLFNTLGLIKPDDRSEGGNLKAEFEYGGSDDYGRKEIACLNVNGDRRNLRSRHAVAVVIKNDQTSAGVSVDRLEPNGNGNTTGATPAPVSEASPQRVVTKKNLPF